MIHRNFNLAPADKGIHKGIIPADVRDGEQLSAILKVIRDGKFTTSENKVWRLSPIGIELLSSPDTESLSPGSSVDLTIKVANQICEFSGLVVCSSYSEGSRWIVGIRWCEQNSETSNLLKRQFKRWSCSQAFMPTGVSANPCIFNDFIYFRIADISKDGMKLITSLRNKKLIPGMYLDTVISFPTIGDSSVKFQIRWINIENDSGHDALALGVRFVNPDKTFLKIAGQYILQFGPSTTVEEIRDAGMTLKSVSAGATFAFVRTAEDYEKVLLLRKLAYSEVGKFDPSTSHMEMGDIFDSRARIVMAKLKGEVIGSLRMMFHDENDKLEHEDFINLPSDFPKNEELIEVTRVCTHPDFRRSDLVYALFRQMIIAALQAKRKWIVGSSTPELFSLYSKLGCKDTGLRYTHTNLGNTPHLIFLLDAPSVVRGEGVSPIVWNILGADMYEFSSINNLIELTTLEQLRLAYYKLWKPVSSLLVKTKRK